MATVLCSIQGCDKPARTRGWCEAHYRRWRRHGAPLGGGTAHGEPARWMVAYLANLPEAVDDCILWPFGRDAINGYGRWRATGSRRAKLTHVTVCEAVHGPRPQGHETRHLCGNPPCINPEHLVWGTPAENQADKLVHGTHNRGQRNGQAKLTAAQVRAIRASTDLQRVLAARYGVTPQHISDIRLRKTWAHIT